MIFFIFEKKDWLVPCELAVFFAAEVCLFFLLNQESNFDMGPFKRGALQPVEKHQSSSLK